ncbi:hypothetical protein HCU64_11585 [Methylobacterium sp. C25]|uniref:hypothetical protein n=1 Tax=Methylobacterium sp. C25 TaxID=2721622 RepID=UPI001F24417B|nr:hypothetical protein [Methylobacterium sp. C25]MCE4224395.1 hypothetical protein [Methylobacterium sp. C25]
MDERRRLLRNPGRGLSQHILPSAATMIGVCTTLVGLVKIIEARVGPSHVDEYAALTALLFLASSGASYLSMRWPTESRLSTKLEAAADVCFVLGLVSLSVISVLFAYEAV